MHVFKFLMMKIFDVPSLKTAKLLNQRIRNVMKLRMKNKTLLIRDLGAKKCFMLKVKG